MIRCFNQALTKVLSYINYVYRYHTYPNASLFFDRDEIQRIKAANPEIPHREAFSAAAKNVSFLFPAVWGFRYTHIDFCPEVVYNLKDILTSCINIFILYCSGLGTFPVNLQLQDQVLGAINNNVRDNILFIYLYIDIVSQSLFFLSFSIFRGMKKVGFNFPL